MPSGTFSLGEISFGEVAGEAISLARALHLLKIDFTEQKRSVPEWPWVVLEWTCLLQAVRELGLEPTEEQVRARMRAFRQEHGLYAASDTERFLSNRGCSVEEFGEAMELLCVREALWERYAREPAERHFAQNRTQYDAVVVSELVVGDEGLCRELMLQIREEGADFDRLASRYSTAPSRLRGGFLGELGRQKLSPREAAALFSAKPDEVVGPFPVQREFRLLRVHEARRAELTDTVRAEIEAQLWAEWLQRRVRASRPQVTILHQL